MMFWCHFGSDRHFEAVVEAISVDSLGGSFTNDDQNISRLILESKLLMGDILTHLSKSSLDIT